MTDDKSLEYETWLEKVNYALMRFENAGMDIKDYRQKVNHVSKICQETNKNTELYHVSTSFRGTLEMPYYEAIRELQAIYSDLKQHEIYVQAKSLTNSITLFLKNEEKNLSNIEFYRDLLLKFLERLKNSKTLPYHLEGQIIDDIYEVAYNFILMEIKTLKHSKTLEVLNQDEIHHLKLNKQIIDDLAKINLRDPIYSGLLKQKENIDISGLESNYAQISFLNSILKSKMSLQEQQDEANALIQSLKYYFNNLKNNFLNLEDERNKKINRQKNFNRCWQNLALSITSTALILNMSGKLFLISKDYSTYKTYRLDETIYSSLDNGITDTSTYVPKDTPPGITYTTYSKWYEYDSYWYQFSDVYELTNLFSTIEDVKNLDIKSLGIEAIGTVNRQNNIDDIINTEYYTIKSTYLDDFDSQDKINKIRFVLYSALSLLVLGLTELILSKICQKFDRQILYKALKDSIDSYKSLKRLKGSNEEEIVKIISKIEQIITTNQELINESIELQEFISSNPKLANEYQELTAILKEIQNFENNKDEILKKERK